VRAFDDFAQRNFFYRAAIGKGYVEGVIPAGDRAILVDAAKIGLVVEENAPILNRTESHHRFLAPKMHPKRIMGRH